MMEINKLQKVDVNDKNNRSTTTTSTKNNNNNNINATDNNNNNNNDNNTIININIGILGHVDSGKTSLVKALSTLLSTAALDKSKQSRERGMTIDLGFSCFYLDVPIIDTIQSPTVAIKTDTIAPTSTTTTTTTTTEHDNEVKETEEQQIQKPTNTNTNTNASTRIQKYQISLVDCPGHASLIRTVIGGSQIIDIVILVIDICKGWQAQTTECLCLAELTSTTRKTNNNNNNNKLLIVLNKIDQYTNTIDQQEQIIKVSNDIKQRLQYTRFNNSNNYTIVPISACVGGQKVASIAVPISTTSTSTSTSASASASASASDNTTSTTALQLAKQSIETYNLNKLIEAIKQLIQTTTTTTTTTTDAQQQKQQLPKEQIVVSKGTGKQNNNNNNSNKNKFYFIFDHCFSIRGRGTIITGTCIYGSISINDIIEFPLQQIQRKIKSIQVFKKQVSTVKQGDRAGICLHNIDSTILERGIVSYPPSSIPLWSYSVIALVRKVRYYPSHLSSNVQYHISVGHTTIMATVSFWGAIELHTKYNSSKNDNVEQQNIDRNNSCVNYDEKFDIIPKYSFDYNEEYAVQSGYIESIQKHNYKTDEGASSGNAASIVESSTIPTNTMKSDLPLHWALLVLQTPIYCPLNSLIIGSRLDKAIAPNYNSNCKKSEKNKRIIIDDDDVDNDDTGSSLSSCRLAFYGRFIEHVPSINDVQKIKLYTTKERTGIVCTLGDEYVRTDDKVIVRYDIYGTSLFKKETNIKVFIGMKVCIVRTGDIGEIKSSYGTDGKFRIYFPSGTTNTQINDTITLQFRRYINDSNKCMYQNHIQLPKERPGTRIVVVANPINNINNKTKSKKTTKKKSNNNTTTTTTTFSSTTNPASIVANVQQNQKQKEKEQSIPIGVCKDGEVVLLKDLMESAVSDENSTSSSNKYSIAIISGFFKPEINIKETAGGKEVRIPSTNEIGIILGPFGKAGKCKVSFTNGISSTTVGAKAELLL